MLQCGKSFKVILLLSAYLTRLHLNASINLNAGSKDLACQRRTCERMLLMKLVLVESDIFIMFVSLHLIQKQPLVLIRPAF